MTLVHNPLNYTIGIDIGDYTVIPILIKDSTIPCNNKVQFNPLTTSYRVYLGNSPLSRDNYLLFEFTINLINIPLFIEMRLMQFNLLIIDISNKIKLLYRYTVPINIHGAQYNYKTHIYDQAIIANYRYKYEVINSIDIIKKRIECNIIQLNSESIKSLTIKFNKILESIDSISNQKLLEIKHIFKTQFFV